MTSKELVKGHEVDVNRLIDTFAEQVQKGDPLTFETFKSVWKSLRFSFVLVCAGSEDEIAGHVQDVFMCALDRLELPSPLKYGHHFGEMHKPRLRRPGPVERSSRLAENLSLDETPPKEQQCAVQESGKNEEATGFCDVFREAPGFPKSELQKFITFEERVAVIYTLYCVYKEQCLEPFVCIHIPADLLPLLLELLPRMQERHIWDALYIFQSLWKENAFVVDVMRRPPSFLSLPLESSASEAKALRELSFHLRTSLQELSRVDAFERMCDDYTSLQQQWAASDIGQSLHGKSLMTFNGDVGKWLRNVTCQEHQQVHQGITGLTAKESSSKRQTHQKKAPEMTAAEKRMWKETLPKITISGDDSWGINAPGLPKMARVVMARDRERRKAAEKTQEEGLVDKGKEQSTVLSRELRSEDFYDACSDLEAFRPRSSPSLEGEAHSEHASDKGSRLTAHEAERGTTVQADSDRDVRIEPGHSAKASDVNESSEGVDDEFSSEDDEEMRQWKQELSVLNEEINQTSESLISKGS